MWWTTHAFDLFVRVWGSARYDVYLFASVMVPAVLYATLLAVWGIDAHHRVAGAVCALVAGLTVWAAGDVVLGGRSSRTASGPG